MNNNGFLNWLKNLLKDLGMATVAAGIVDTGSNQIKGIFASDVKESVRKKVKPMIFGLDLKDEENFAVLRTKLSTNENQLLDRWLKGLQPWQRNQLRMLLIGIYNDFSPEDSLAVLQAFINTPDDDQDEYKNQVLKNDGILTDYNPINVFHEKHPVRQIIEEHGGKVDGFFANLLAAIVNVKAAAGKVDLKAGLQRIKKVAGWFAWLPLTAIGATLLLDAIGIWTGFPMLIGIASFILVLPLIVFSLFANGIFTLFTGVLYLGEGVAGIIYYPVYTILHMLGANPARLGEINTEKMRKNIAGLWDLVVPVILMRVLLIMAPTWKTFGSLPMILLLAIAAVILAVGANIDKVKVKRFWLTLISILASLLVGYLILSVFLPKTMGNGVKAGFSSVDDWMTMKRVTTVSPIVPRMESGQLASDTLANRTPIMVDSDKFKRFDGLTYKAVYKLSSSGAVMVGYIWDKAIKNQTVKDWSMAMFDKTYSLSIPSQENTYQKGSVILDDPKFQVKPGQRVIWEKSGYSLKYQMWIRVGDALISLRKGENSGNVTIGNQTGRIMVWEDGAKNTSEGRRVNFQKLPTGDLYVHVERQHQ